MFDGQILVTHHVELLLPGAHYLIRMLDGRIDTQGTVKDLRLEGVLDSIVRDEFVQAQQEFRQKDVESASDISGQPAEGTKLPRKLIEDEHREVGRVKWSIYKTYLQAS